MTVYVRNRRKVKVKRGLVRVDACSVCGAHIDSSQFSYEQGAVVRSVRNTTIHNTADVAYIPVVSVIEEVTCGCSRLFRPTEDLCRNTWLKLRCLTV